MYKYPDGTLRVNPPTTVVYNGYIRKFTDLSTEEAAGLGYYVAVPIKREQFTIYETRWDLDGLIYREYIVSSTVDTTAKLSNDIAEIENRYAIKLSALDASLINALWADGEAAAEVRAELSAKRSAAIIEKTAEINALFGL
jgi:hypothetical protein